MTLTSEEIDRITDMEHQKATTSLLDGKSYESNAIHALIILATFYKDIMKHYHVIVDECNKDEIID